MRERPSERGVTITELMVAVAIMTIGVLAMFGAFRYVNVALHVARGKTLATNLAQEKVESLKNLTYYELLVTTASATDSSVTPAVTYDTANYPPETIAIGGMTFTRYTYVTMVNVANNVITSVASNYPDTGMKQMTVSIVWTTDGGARKQWVLNNLLENPNVNPLDSTLSGYAAAAASGAKLAGVSVTIPQYPDYSAVTDSNGNYSFRIAHGSYTVMMSTPGYFTWSSPTITISRGGTTVVNSSMTAIASGTVSGIAWYNPGLVISQVVGTTTTVAASDHGHGSVCGSPQDVEYVELFNPTTYQINVAKTVGSGLGSAQENVRLNTQLGNSYFNDVMGGGGASYVYVSSYVPAGGYYLIASYPAFVANGQWIAADAYYNNACSAPNLIANHSCGSVRLTDAGGSIIDQVCWNGDSCAGATQYCNGAQIPTDANCGMNTGYASPACHNPPWEGNQLVRISSPAVLGRGTWGSAYDSQNNSLDFQYPISGSAATIGLNYSPYISAGSTLAVITGIPAIGAYVSASDYNSGSTQTYTAYIPSGGLSLPYAPFTLVDVATGTWSLNIALSSYYASIASVTVAASGSQVPVLSAATSPAWISAGIAAIELASSTLNGFVKGQVTDAGGNALAGITVQCAGVSKLTDVNGLYFMSVSSGPVVIIANPNNANPNYTQSIYSVTVYTSQSTSQNIALAQGGVLQGYMTTGTTPVPNFTVAALQGGNQMGSAVTNTSGVFTIRNLSTGTYTVQPTLDAGQTASPASFSPTLTAAGGTVFVGTFTITGAFGSITGTVSNNGALVTSGALILASTSTIASTPPSIAGSSAPALSPLYAVSSKADGTYALPVRGSSTYNIGVWVPTLQGTSSVSTVFKSYSGVVVSPGAATTQNLSLP